MPENCCLCKNLHGFAGISFHRFPLDVQIKEKWKKAIGKNVNAGLVCSEHFAPEDFHKEYKKGASTIKKLKRGAIPSLLLKNAEISYKETIWNHNNQNALILENKTDSASLVITSETCKGEPQVTDSKTPCKRSYNSSINRDATPAKIRRCNYGNGNLRNGVSSNQRKRKFVFNSTTNQVRRVRYIGDFTPNDFTCPANYEVVQKYHKMSKHKIQSQRKTICRLKSKVNTAKDLLSTLRSKGLITSNGSSLMEIVLTPVVSQILARALKENKTICPPELQGFAATLMFHSASAYDFVRSVFLKSLPHPRTVRSWFQSHDFQPGILLPVLESLQNQHEMEVKKGKTLEYGLQTDEMSIKKQIQLVGGKTYGYVDLGDGIKMDSVEAKNALVFMVVALNGHFKVPIAFYFIDSLDGEQRANLTLEVLRALHDYNIANVRSFTFDCPTYNITMAAKLGCDTDKSSEEALVFLHPNSKEPIVAIPDACHMLKLARNTLGDYDLADGDGNIISFKYLKQLVDVQTEEGLHLATKIRRRHIKYCKEKMKVKTAAQTLSESCAVGLEFLEFDAQHDKFQGAQATAIFCRNINNIFDLLNSKKSFFVSNETKKCICKDNLSIIKRRVDDYIKYLKSLKLIVRDSRDPGNFTAVPLLESTRYTGFWGFVKSMKGALKLAEYLFLNTNMDFLLTYKLSQDHLETFFSCVRRRGGFNNNPSCRDFISAVVRLLTHAKVISPKSANCLQKDKTNLLSVELNSSTNNTSSKETNNFEFETSETPDNFYDFGHSYEAPFNWSWNMYKENIVTYIAGSVVKTLKKQSNALSVIFHWKVKMNPAP